MKFVKKVVKFVKKQPDVLRFAGLSAGVVAIALIFSNPNRESYQDYAVSHLPDVLEQYVCSQLPPQFKQFSQQCRSVTKLMVNIGTPQLKTIIDENTERYNYGLFSIYYTSISLDDFTPFTSRYEAETIGILQQFYTYHLSEQEGGGGN